MKTLFIVTAAVAALAATAPASAQYSSRDGNRYDNRYASNNYADFDARFDYRLDQLEERIDSGIRTGVIDRRQARDLRWQLGELTRLQTQYGRNGFNDTERQDLDLRLRSLRQNLRVADSRSDGWYDRNDRYGSWDDYDSRYRGVGGPYEDDDTYRDDQTQNRGGVLGTILGNVFGTSLRPGQRASGNLYAVPSQYRSTYRDGNGVYYRSDGRSIYQIDSRSDTVRQVFPMPR